MLPACAAVRMGRPPKGGVMDILWTTITFLFVVGTLAVVAFATYRIFGGWYTHQH
jgi:hypothetical protein